MSHFDDLNQLYKPWHDQWFEDYMRLRQLPPRIARGFGEFIGAPESYPGLDLSDQTKTNRYVSPTRAQQEADGKFTLNVEEVSGLMSEIDFDEDGSFYFGLRIMLESAPNSYPKGPFWFLFRGKVQRGHFEVWLHRTSERFELGANDSVEMQRLFEHILDQLKFDLTESPLVRRSPEPTRIGFGPPPKTR